MHSIRLPGWAARPYHPLPPRSPGGLGERLVRCRTAFGITQSELAQRLEVDACTPARWERGEREPTGTFKARVSRFLNAAEAAWGGDAEGAAPAR